jgi:hypothetical protein
MHIPTYIPLGKHKHLNLRLESISHLPIETFDTDLLVLKGSLAKQMLLD